VTYLPTNNWASVFTTSHTSCSKCCCVLSVEPSSLSYTKVLPVTLQPLSFKPPTYHPVTYEPFEGANEPIAGPNEHIVLGK